MEMTTLVSNSLLWPLAIVLRRYIALYYGLHDYRSSIGCLMVP
jgi:hypothetical protein